MVVGCGGLFSFAKRSADSIGDGALKAPRRPQSAVASKMIFNIFFLAAVLASDRSRGSSVPAAERVHEDHGTYRSIEVLGMVLIMETSFCAWYLLRLAVVLIMARSVKRWYLIAMLSSSK